MNFTKLTTLTLFSVLTLLLTTSAFAALEMDSIQFDPAIIASGDSVDIVVQFHDSGIIKSDTRIGNPDYRFNITLTPEDTISQQYITILDANGNELTGLIYPGERYNRKFRIKVNENAPAGDYQFRLTGTWEKNGAIGESTYIKFMLPVKREGVVLSIANVVSTPSKVRAGDKEILLTTSVSNSGEKTAKDIKLSLQYPQGISASYTNNNQLTLGVISDAKTKDAQFYVDTDKTMPSGMYTINVTMRYRDIDNQEFQTYSSFPFVVQKRPNIIIVNASGQGLAGDEVTIVATLKNIGEETADSVDARIVKQSSQPFDMDVRSDYLGQIKPGQTATAIFHVAVKPDADQKEHRLSVTIRASGARDEGDDNIYIFDEQVPLTITGKKENPYPMYGGILAIVVILGAIAYGIMNRKGSR